jgi:hypothetical protein
MKITFRKDYAWKWRFVNPVLRENEPGREIDTGRFKIGDGVTPWNDLEYTDKIKDLEYIIGGPERITML